MFLPRSLKIRVEALDLNVSAALKTSRSPAPEGSVVSARSITCHRPQCCRTARCLCYSAVSCTNFGCRSAFSVRSSPFCTYVLSLNSPAARRQSRSPRNRLFGRGCLGNGSLPHLQVHATKGSFVLGQPMNIVWHKTSLWTSSGKWSTDYGYIWRAFRQIRADAWEIKVNSIDNQLRYNIWYWCEDTERGEDASLNSSVSLETSDSKARSNLCVSSTCW